MEKTGTYKKEIHCDNCGFKWEETLGKGEVVLTKDAKIIKMKNHIGIYTIKDIVRGLECERCGTNHKLKESEDKKIDKRVNNLLFAISLQYIKDTSCKKEMEKERKVFASKDVLKLAKKLLSISDLLEATDSQLRSKIQEELNGEQ